MIWKYYWFIRCNYRFSAQQQRALLTEVIENGGNKPLVIATTGFNKHQQNLLLKLVKLYLFYMLLIWVLGVAVLNKLVALASKTLRDFDIEMLNNIIDIKLILHQEQL